MKSDKKRILNVDGHGDSTEMAPLFFGTRNCDVVIANKMAEGLALATSGRFDLYLLDTAFADGSGVELARRVRAFDPETPLVFYKVLNAQVEEDKAR
jgi:DNA-binding response OmpR family regulator